MATISSVKIANMALSHVGAKSSIESFTENSAEARQVNLWYDYSRLQALEAFNWNFARKRITLAVHSEAAPTDIWAYRYQYPADCILVREIANPAGKLADAVPFDIEVDATGNEKTILTDVQDAKLVYTFDVTAPSLFSAFFVEVLSHLLAYHITFSITGDLKLKAAQLQIYMALMNKAPAHNANEAMGAAPREAPWIRGR